MYSSNASLATLSALSVAAPISLGPSVFAAGIISFNSPVPVNILSPAYKPGFAYSAAEATPLLIKFSAPCKADKLVE